MKFLYLLLFACFTYLNAYDVSLDSRIPIYKQIELSADISGINDALQNPQKFKTQDYFRRYLRKKQVDKSLWVRLELTNSSNNTLVKEFFTRWDHTNIDMYIIKDNQLIKKSKFREYKNFHLSNSFEIGAKENLQIYLNVKLEKRIDDFYYLYIISKEDEMDFIVQKEKYFHNGLFLGLLLSMMMYNFFMYFSMHIRSYLYLALYQLTIVFYVSELRTLAIIFLEDYENFSYYLLKIGSSVLLLFFSILFTKEFLNTKKNMPIINLLLNVFFILNIVSQFISFEPVNYVAFLYLLYVIAGIYSFIQGNKYALFYIIGFAPTVIFYVTFNFSKIFNMDIYIEYQSVIQVLAVIEAFAFSMALYLKLKSIIKEKEEAQKSSLEKERIMIEQSRFATMGEMLASITHQWKQPLNHLNAIFGNLVLAHEHKKLDGDYLNKKSLEAHTQLKYMANTIEDFNNFFSSNKKLEQFTLEEAFYSALELVNSRIKKNNIEIKVQLLADKHYVNYKNGLIQALIIVLNNALDAIVLRDIKNGQISVLINNNIIEISDNAGGIEENVIKKIFDPYFSTKDKKFGTGMGLYTAKVIMNNVLKGQITAKNKDGGACFTLDVKVK